MNKTYKVLAWLTLPLAVLGIFMPLANGTLGSISTSYDLLNTIDGYQVDDATLINGSGAWTASSSPFDIASLQIDSGTTINEFTCATATWDPPTISSSTVATTTISLTGLAAGDMVFASIATSTNGGSFDVNAEFATSNSAMVILNWLDASSTYLTGSVNIGSVTARACYLGF